MKRSPLRRDTGEARTSAPALKSRKCPVKRGGCGKPFRQTRPGQIACSADCALAIGGRIRVEQARDAVREEKKADRAKLSALKPLSHWRKLAQAALNAWVKARDAQRHCISCTAHPVDTDQAGHYLTRGARPELALDPANVHRQCVRCNLHLHGNQAAYRVALVARIGLHEVERLEGPNPPRHDTADSLKALAAEYRAKLRALKKANA